MAVEGTRCCSTCRAIYRTDFERCPTDGTRLEMLANDPLIGATLAKHYTIDALIGEGGMGRVYRAHHALLHHRQFAVKIMLGDLATTLQMRMRFGQEADSVSRLAHPNVVSVVDYGRTDEGLLFLAMELLEGRTLAEVIDSEAPLAPRRALELARQVCLGLAHAHDRGLVHRDFKPENLMIVRGPEGERAVIMDFGIAIARDAEDETQARLTSMGTALGTPIYAAPEQTHGRPVDHRADLFALGVTLYEMLSGRVPFDGTSLEVIHQNAGSSPPSIEARSGVHVDPAIEAVVRRLMARSPDDRFGSAHEVFEVLGTVAAAPVQASRTEPALTTSTAAATTDRLPSRRRRWKGAALTALIVIAIPVGWRALRSNATVESSSPRVTAAVAPISSPRSPLPPAPVERTVEPSPAEVVPAPREERTERIIAAPPRRSAPAKVRVAPEVTRSPVAEVISDALPEASSSQPGEPVPIAPPPAPPAAELPANPAPPISTPAPLQTRARSAFAALEVRGSLSTAEIRRALERLEPELRRCFATVVVTTRRSSAATVHVTFVVDDTRQATAVRASAPAWPPLATCVGSVIGALRTRTAPDVGSVPVSLDVSFSPEAS